MFNGVKVNLSEAMAGSDNQLFIDSNGKYKGKIFYVSEVIKPSNAIFANIRFKSDEGKMADISICTHGKDGKPTFGYNRIMAMAAILNIDSFTTSKIRVKEYQADLGYDAEVDREVINEFTNQPIGFLLHRVDYTGSDGFDYFNIEITAPFDYYSEQTAKEHVNNLPAARIAELLPKLKDRDIRKKRNLPNDKT